MHNPSLSNSRPRTGILVILLALLATASASLAQQQPAQADQRVVRVVGHGVVYGQPDVATVELGVTAVDPDAGAAVEEIDRRMREVLASLARLDVPQQDIRTTAYNIWREEQLPREGETTGQPVFRAQHMIAVELEGARRAGEILAAAVEAGANAVGGITFGFSDPEELKAQARAQAVEDARMRATQLAAAAGVALGEPLVIEEIPVTGGPIPYLERSMAVASAAPISPGQLSVEVQVAVTYAIQ
ncbi:MAG TPA: SIMPL domain-containing protein [Trueperaceae bacterium]